MKNHSKATTPTFRTLIEQLARRHDAYKVFSSFCTLAACALAAQTREAEYLEEVKRWDKDEMNIFSHALGALTLEMESRPFTDILGGHYMDFALSHKSAQWGGEFHTPQHVCELMAQLVGTDDSIPDDGPITLCEPACGAGAMILAYAHKLGPKNLQRLRVTAIDIKKVCCDMCFINTTLWGIPAEIIHGNALSNEYFAAWKNIHWIFRGMLPHLFPSATSTGETMPENTSPAVSIAEKQSAASPSMPCIAHPILTEIAASQGKPPASATIAKIQAAIQQQEFDFAS